MPIEAIKTHQYKNLPKQDKEKELNKTLKGVLINNHIKSVQPDSISFNDIENSLLIPSQGVTQNTDTKDTEENTNESSFNVKKAIKPLLIGTGMILGTIVGLSAILSSSSKKILNSKSFEQLPDLAVNMNIKQEPQFAIYRAIRDPNYKNILGASAVIIMSGITIIAKNFVDGLKEIWLKKQSADIEKDLQENLIEVETSAFSGKLNTVNEMLTSNLKYFNEILNRKTEKSQTPAIFKSFLSFKGEEQKSEEKNIDNKKQKLKNIKYILLTAGVIIAAIVAGKISLNNLRKTAQNTNTLANKIAENTINAIEEKAKNPKSEDIEQIIEYLKSICAKPEYIKEVGAKYKLSEDKIKSIIEETERAKKMIFADAPTALGGIPKKIQYYCYIDEERGHLYNWILNPENKFTKYLFLAFTLYGATAYVFKQALDAIKETAVLKENTKTELNLRKKLVDTEIKNFKSKKESAIKPLLENFYKQAQSGQKSKEELKQIADNILTETKNGPPYVYT